VNGKRHPRATIASVVIASGKLGRLFRGDLVVRITKMTSVCVASDSTNHPVWKSASLA
jgi:hypothetical protein